MSSKNSIGISHIASHLPANRVKNKDLVAKYGFDEEFLTEKLGINERRRASQSETASTLGAAAARKALQTNDINPADLDALVVVTQTPDYCLPHTSALVHEILDLPTTVPVFDVSLGCSGFVYGLSIITSFLEMNEGNNGLLITADTYSKVMNPGDRATAPLFGDGAAAALLTRVGEYVPGRFSFGSDGGRHQALIVPGSGTRKNEEQNYLRMDGRAIFNFMMSEIPEDIDHCLKSNELEKDQIDLWVFHQASKFMLQSLAKKLEIPEEKMFVDMADIGNTTSSTIPIALERSVFKSGKRPARVLVSGFGVGLSWASTVLSLRLDNLG